MLDMLGNQRAMAGVDGALDTEERDYRVPLNKSKGIQQPGQCILHKVMFCISLSKGSAQALAFTLAFPPVLILSLLQVTDFLCWGKFEGVVIGQVPVRGVTSAVLPLG